MKTNTPEEVKADFARKGISIAQWAVANSVSAPIAYELLAGRKKGNRGQAHRAAVLLGLKEGEIVSTNDIKHPRAA